MRIRQKLYKIIASLIALVIRDKVNERVKFLVYTGTVGKTTMRDTVVHLLKQAGINVRSNALGYTSEIGIILSILGVYEASLLSINTLRRIITSKIPDNTYVCIELGADFYYDIPWFLKRFKPFSVFMSGIYDKFWSGNLDKQNEERLTLINSIQPGGTVFYNSDDEEVKKLISKLDKNIKRKSFSINNTGDLADINFEKTDQNINRYIANAGSGYIENLQFKTRENRYSFGFTFPVLMPQLYALECAILFAEIYLPDAFARIEEYFRHWKFSNLRLRWHITRHGAVVLEDSYKSTPMCFNWLINEVQEMHTKNMVLVISEIRPLTINIQEVYETIASKLSNFKFVYFIGPSTIYENYFKRNLNSKYVIPNDYEKLANNLLINSQKGDLIVVKGSEKYDLHTIVNLLKNE